MKVFVVDRYQDHLVIIRQAHFVEGWVVERGSSTLHQGEWSEKWFDTFSDREAALTAYQELKQRYEG